MGRPGDLQSLFIKRSFLTCHSDMGMGLGHFAREPLAVSLVMGPELLNNH